MKIEPRPARCLVIGGFGFLGSRFAGALLGAGHQVRVLDRAAATAGSSSATRGAEIMIGDLADPADLSRAITGAECVIHAAYATVPRTAAEDPIHDLSANVVALLHLLRALGDHGCCRKLIYLSSGGTVYGRPTALPITEDHPTDPISAYGVSKLACEKYVQLYGARHTMDPVILRLSNPYGSGHNLATPQGAVGHFLRRIAEDLPLEIWGDGSVVRDYFFVDDLCDLAPRLLSPATTSGVFNIGSGRGRTLLDVIATIQEVVGAPVRVVHLPAQPYDAPRNVLDVARARAVLGWVASTDFADGVAKTWQQIVRARQGSKG